MLRACIPAIPCTGMPPPVSAQHKSGTMTPDECANVSGNDAGTENDKSENNNI